MLVVGVQMYPIHGFSGSRTAESAAEVAVGAHAARIPKRRSSNRVALRQSLAAGRQQAQEAPQRQIWSREGLL